jgi:hypothetical protein
VRQLEKQVGAQSARSADKVRQLTEQVADVNLALDEARRLGKSMSSFLGD